MQQGMLSAAGAVSVTVDQANATITVTCPQGTTYTGGQGITACRDMIPGKSSGEGFVGSADEGGVGHRSFTLEGTGTPNGMLVFDCSNQ